jgi:hypothetical protein
MAEESTTPAGDIGSSHSANSATAQGDDGGAHGVLRDAIRKVMSEIEHHERAAKHHLEQAAGLRKALRESISFLQEQGDKRTATVAGARARSEKSASPSPEPKAKQTAAAGKHDRSKKK